MAGASSARTPLTSQRLKEDEDRAKYHSKAVEYGTDGVRGSLGVCNQIEECEANDQEDDEPLDPRHVGLLILPFFTADYSNTLLRVQAEASILSFLDAYPQPGTTGSAGQAGADKTGAEPVTGLRESVTKADQSASTTRENFTKQIRITVRCGNQRASETLLAQSSGAARRLRPRP